MIQLTPHMRILVAVEPADFRKGIDGLTRVCREQLRQDPFRGILFVFRNRRATSIKALLYDGQGFWMCQKRLSKGRFAHWPQNGSSATQALEAHQLGVLLAGGNPAAAKGCPSWRRVDGLSEK
jgi:transposase